MIDTHCHVDLYPRPSEIALQAERAGVLTIIVTNLPSAFERAYPHVHGLRKMRLALGLHPLVAEQHATERKRFKELVDKTSYIGEVGLDFSREGVQTKKLQIDSLRFVFRALDGKPKFITLHSRRAESALLDIIEEEKYQWPVVFHWYSGTLETLGRVLANGHYFSINPAMLKSKNGQKIAESLPQDRVLTESDGPFVKVGSRDVLPSDVQLVENHLASVWQVTSADVRKSIKENFMRLIQPLRS